MHVLIDAIAARLGGNLTVLRNLLAALVEADGGRNRYTVVGRKVLHDQLDPHPRVSLQTSPFAESNLLARLAWEQLAIPAQSLFGEVDLVFAPSGLAVFACPKPQVLMFQNAAPFDAKVLATSEPLDRARLFALQKLGIASAHAADQVVFISEFARDLLLPVLGISAQKASVLYLGRDPAFSPAAKGNAGPVLRRYQLDGAVYLLSVSHFYHYKNLVELVQGFALARPELPAGMKLVLAGSEHEPGYSRKVRAAVREGGLETQVVFTGNVPREDLPALYASAAAFLFPSQCESFPNILIEGLASGAPTLASRAGPMPELAGDAARYFDGTEPKGIAAEMVRVFREPSMAARLSAFGVEQAARYSWERTAKSLLETFDALAGTPREASSTADYFGGMAKGWGARYGKSNFSERREIVAGWLRELKPGKLVDVGCGSGQLSEVAQQMKWQTASLDLSPRMLQAARGLGLRALAAADARSLPLRSGSADALLSFSMLEYVPHPATVIGEMARVLRPGGSLLLSIPNRASALRKVEAAVAGLRKRKLLGNMLSARFAHLDYLDYAKTRLSGDELRALLESAGFRVESVGHFTPARAPGNRLQAVGMNSYFIATRD